MDQCDSDLVPQSSENPRGLFVKFKIPKTSFEDDDDDQDQDRNQNLGHVCHFCSKRFSSGKALGGHIRVHMLKPRSGKKTPQRYLRSKLAEEEEEKREVKFRSFPGGGGGGGEEEKGSPHKCCLCSKEFRSMKSLFGHMRNHPERGWRGIRPPPGDGADNNSCSSSTVSENELLQVDTKRRRIQTAPSDNIEVPEAAFILMEMAYSGQTLDWGKLVRNPSFVYDDDDEDDDDEVDDDEEEEEEEEEEDEEEKLGQMRAVVMKEKKRKRKMERELKQQLDFDLNQPYVDGEGTLAHN